MSDSPTEGQSSDQVQVRTASSDITVGPNRLLFTILDEMGRPLNTEDVTLRFFRTEGDNTDLPIAETTGQHLGAGEAAAQGLYVVRLDLPEPGGYLVEATLRRAGRAPTSATTGFRAKVNYDVPGIGESAPASAHPTSSSTPIEWLTSARPVGDPEFYRLTIGEALAEKKPLVVIFSTPAFCQTRRCGPQLHIAESLRPVYANRINFIHIEILERPDLVLAGEAQPKVRDIVREWRLPTEPWVFLIDENGLIFDRFEGFSPRAEMEASIQRLLSAA